MNLLHSRHPEPAEKLQKANHVADPTTHYTTCDRHGETTDGHDLLAHVDNR